MFDQRIDCPRCKRHLVLTFWDYVPFSYGYQHVYCPHCGGESKFGLKARVATAAALFVFVIGLFWLADQHVSVPITLLAAFLGYPLLIAVSCRPFVTLEPTDAGQRFKRARPFLLCLALLYAAWEVAGILGIRP